MANAEYLELLRQGVRVWNQCRISRADLHRADLGGADLRGLDLTGVDLADTYLDGANLSGAKLSKADLSDADLTKAHLCGERTHLNEANLRGAILSGAKLCGANLREANLRHSYLDGANLSKASLHGAILADADLTDADLSGCYVYGISAWGVKLSAGTIQQGLIITATGEPEAAVDNIEVAQLFYLLHNEKIRDVIDTVGKKCVLLLGRFTEGRIAVLDWLRDELRERGYLPIVFNFDKPETKDFTETVRLLAGLSKFVIADLTSPKSAPYELGAIVSQTMIPFQPIIAADEKPFSMLQDLWINYPDRVFRPIHYSSVDALIVSLDEKIIRPAEARFVELLKRKADTMGGEHV